MNTDEILMTLVNHLDQVRRELLELRITVEHLRYQSSQPLPEQSGQVHYHHWPTARAMSESTVQYSHHYSSSGGYLAVWIYQQGGWQLDPTSLPKGVSSGPPPNIEGEFEGQCVKTERRG